MPNIDIYVVYEVKGQSDVFIILQLYSTAFHDVCLHRVIVSNILAHTWAVKQWCSEI